MNTHLFPVDCPGSQSLRESVWSAELERFKHQGYLIMVKKDPQLFVTA